MGGGGGGGSAVPASSSDWKFLMQFFYANFKFTVTWKVTHFHNNAYAQKMLAPGFIKEF